MLMTIKIDHPLISNRYQIETLLGSGSMGHVYRARDNRTGQIVALKQVAALDQTAAGHEFQLLAALDHPGIIDVYNFGWSAAGRPFITMQFLDGAIDIVSANQGKSQQQKLQLLWQMFEALAYLHSRDILHRDLKPANVLVCANQVKLLDFGLAALVETDIDQLQGTPAYLPPELLRGDQPSAAADVYACGVIVYECLVGRHPFNTSSMNNLLLDALYKKPAVDDLLLKVPVKEFLQAILSADPGQRLTAVQAAGELSQIQWETADCYE